MQNFSARKVRKVFRRTGLMFKKDWASHWNALPFAGVHALYLCFLALLPVIQDNVSVSAARV